MPLNSYSIKLHSQRLYLDLMERKAKQHREVYFQRSYRTHNPYDNCEFLHTDAIEIEHVQRVSVPRILAPTS